MFMMIIIIIIKGMNIDDKAYMYYIDFTQSSRNVVC